MEVKKVTKLDNLDPLQKPILELLNKLIEEEGGEIYILELDSSGFPYQICTNNEAIHERSLEYVHLIYSLPYFTDEFDTGIGHMRDYDYAFRVFKIHIISKDGYWTGEYIG